MFFLEFLENGRGGARAIEATRRSFLNLARQDLDNRAHDARFIHHHSTSRGPSGRHVSPDRVRAGRKL